MTNPLEELNTLHKVHSWCKAMVGLMDHILLDKSDRVGYAERVADYQEHLACLVHYAMRVDESVRNTLGSQANAVIDRVGRRMAAREERNERA